MTKLIHSNIASYGVPRRNRSPIRTKANHLFHQHMGFDAPKSAGQSRLPNLTEKEPNLNNWKRAITLAICCCVYLAVTPSTSADYIGVTTVDKDDPWLEFICVEAEGDFVPYPLTVCNVYAAFDDPDNVLLSVGNADLQVYGGQNPDVFYQHPFGGNTPPSCNAPPVLADVMCDSYVAIGNKCSDWADGTTTDPDFDSTEFNSNGHIVGGWFNANPTSDQGRAGTWPNLQVLFLQSSVEQTLHMSGVVNLFWLEGYGGDIYAEIAVPVECAAVCLEDDPCDDGDPCTQNDLCDNHICTGTPIDCDDNNPCTEESCDDGQCVYVPVPDGTSCDDGNACTVGSECTDGKCGGGQPIDCDDGDLCTNDFCGPEGVCEHTPSDYCDDDDACTEDGCDPNGGCWYIVTDCNDGDFCTYDSCDHEDTGNCTHTPIDICNDGNACTEDTCDSDTGCTNTPIDCDDGDLCTVDDCDPDLGCYHPAVIQCSEDYTCDPETGVCVEIYDPCDCVDGHVTLCHVPPGNLANARTITVGCAARDRHLAHGDFCGPCE